MLVKWDVECIKVIPTVEDSSSVVLVPGYNDVPDAKWKYARPRVLKLIEDGKMTEEWKKVTEEQAKDYAVSIPYEKGYGVPAELSEIQRPRVSTVVKNTYHIPTLEAWLGKEQRQDVRINILQQLSDLDKNNYLENQKRIAVQLERNRA